MKGTADPPIYLPSEDHKTLADMWKFIEEKLNPCNLTPKKEDLTQEQILKLYFDLSIIDEMFRQLAQIAILKAEIDKIKSGS